MAFTVIWFGKTGIVEKMPSVTSRALPMHSRRSSATMSTWSSFTPSGTTSSNKTLKVTPAMAAGVSSTLWSMEDLCERWTPSRANRASAVLYNAPHRPMRRPIGT